MILQLLDKNTSQSEITKILQVNKSYVSKVKKMAIEQGLLVDGKLVSETLDLSNFWS